MKEGEGISQRTCMHDTQAQREGQREVGAGDGWRWAKGGKMGTSIIMSTTTTKRLKS